MTDTKDFLRGLMGRYTTDNVDDPVAFKKRIDEFLAMDDYKMEGYTSPEKQRDYSVKFQWGHNHDFGDFQIEGVLGDRHIDLIATFIDDFGLPKNLTDKQILDVGVWCGGTSMLLSAMGNPRWVAGMEEVEKYQRCANFLAQSFHLQESFPLVSWSVVAGSLYEVPIKEQMFDYIIFPGVLYHLTDPILALRILFNALKDGGTLFIESAGSFEFTEIIKYRGGDGWSWFVPTVPTLRRMLHNVGFENVNLSWQGVVNGSRISGSAQRIKHKDMLRAGLSNRYVA